MDGFAGLQFQLDFADRLSLVIDNEVAEIERHLDVAAFRGCKLPFGTLYIGGENGSQRGAQVGVVENLG